MRIAIIDLGTNSVRFDVHQLGPGRKVRQIHREKIMVRLGQGVFLNGKLDRNAMNRTFHAFTRFKRLASHYRASKVVAFGTSALREVSDRDSFLQEIRSRTGIDLRVISGAEEAQLIALGVMTGETIGKGTVALVDIGGGSTEISLCRGKNVLHSHSFPLGTARLQQIFLKTSPPHPAKLEELRHSIRTTLYSVLLPERWSKADRIVGSSGTIKALARILSKGGKDDELDREKLRALNRVMGGMSTTELLNIEGMEPKRVDMILAGSILFEEIMDVLGAKRAVATEFSLRDGILEEELRIYRQGDLSHLALHLPDLYEKALRFGGDEKHLRRTVAVAERIYDDLAPVHRLRPEWKLYLLAAVILRDTGEAISPARKAEHSFYIVKNGELPAAESWEIEWIAQLCRLHESTKLDNKQFSFVKNKVRRDVFARLLALLRVVDALDSGPETHLKLKKPRITRTRVTLPIGGRGLTGLEKVNLEKASEFFLQVTGREIEAS